MRRLVAAFALVVCASSASLRATKAAEKQAKEIVLVVENLDDAAITCEQPEVRIGAGRSATVRVSVPTEVRCGSRSGSIVGDGYGVARVYAQWVDVGDANDFQLELSRAAHRCAASTDHHEPSVYESLEACVFEVAFGGLDRAVAPRAWRQFWSDEAYWRLCERTEEARPSRTFASEAIPNADVEVLREAPFVAAVRGFLSAADCAAVVESTPAVANLGRAHVGGRVDIKIFKIRSLSPKPSLQTKRIQTSISSPEGNSRPKISRIDFDLTELERSEVFVGTPQTSG